MALTVERSSAAPETPPVREATLAEGKALLDRRARRYLGISGDEFIRRWESGYYAADPDAPGVQNVVAVLAFAQQAT